MRVSWSWRERLENRLSYNGTEHPIFMENYYFFQIGLFKALSSMSKCLKFLVLEILVGIFSRLDRGCGF